MSDTNLRLYWPMGWDYYGIIIVDSSEMEKKGEESVEVDMHYSGHAGKVKNFQSGVFIGYTSRIGYRLVDR